MNNIDDIFKKGLDGKGMEYSEGHWGAMEQLLVAKKVGLFARYKWMISTFSVVIVGCIIYFMGFDNTATSTSLVDTPTADAAQESMIISENSEINTSIIDEENTRIEEAKTITNANIKENSTAGQTVNDNVKGNSTSGQTSSEERVIRKLSREEQPKVGDGSAETVGSAESRNTTIYETRIVPGEDKVSNERRFAEIDQVDIEEANAMYSYPITAVANEGAVDVARKVDDDKISKLQFRGLSSLTISAPSKKEVKQLKSPLGKKWAYFVVPHVGYVMYDRSRDLAEFNAESQNKSSEISKSSISYGIDVAAKRKNWSVRTGVELLNLKESTNYTTTSSKWEYTYAKRIINKKYSETPRGTTVALIADVKVDSTEVSLGEQSLCEDCEVNFNYISVPLNVQYELGNGRLRYFAAMGATASFLRSATGKYLVDSDKDELFLEDIASSPAIRKTLLTAEVRVGSKCYITPGMSLWASYGYGLGLNSMTTVYEQNPRLQSIRLGLEFKLR